MPDTASPRVDGIFMDPDFTNGFLSITYKKRKGKTKIYEEGFRLSL
jgi:hypothetical protein